MIAHATSIPAWKQELLEKRRINDEEIQRRKDEEIRRLQVYSREYLYKIIMYNFIEMIRHTFILYG